MLAVSIFTFFGPMAFARTKARPSTTPTSAAQSSKEAQEEAAQLAPSEAQVHFAEQYISAVNAKDVNALRQLVAPKTLACYTDRTEPFLTDWLKRQTRDTITPPYTIKVEKYDENLPRSALITMPMAPTHQLDIIVVENGKELVMGRPIAYQDGRWYETAPCPTDLGMEKFTTRTDRTRRAAEELDKLYANLKDPMRADLKNLISQNRIGEACTKYSAAEKIDFKTGCVVVKRLAASMGINVK